MNEEITTLTVDIAKEFISLLQASGQPWTTGFYRFKSEEYVYGANASFVVGEDVLLISAMKHKYFYERINEMGRKLFNILGKYKGLFLIIADNEFNYEIKFEWEDLNKWEITKIDGGTGMPSGL